MAVRSLKFVLTGEDKSASKTLGKVGDNADRLHKRFADLAGGLAGGALAVGVVGFGKASVGAFKEAQQSQAALQDAFAKFPKLADSNIGAFQKLNSQLERKTKFDDDALASGQAVLAQFNLTGKQIKGITPLLADYAARTGQDIPTAAKSLGMAFNGNTRALKQVGINYKSTGDKGKDFANIQALLSAKVGGFATNEGKTAEGQLQILGNQYGELQETVGSKLVPALTKLSGGLLSVVDFMSRNSKVIGPLVKVVGGLVGVFWLAAKAAKAFEVVMTVLDIELAANPVGLVVVALAALGVGMVLLWKKSETFRTIVTGAFKALGGVVLTLVDTWLHGWQLIAEGMSHLPFIGDKFKGVADGIGHLRDKIGELKSDLAGLGEHVTRIPVVIDVKSNLGQAVQAATNAKRDRLDGARALGGPVVAGGSYLVGERGPEIFSPRSSGVIIPSPRGRSAGNVVVNIHGPVYGAGARELAEQLVPHITRGITKRVKNGAKMPGLA